MKGAYRSLSLALVTFALVSSVAAQNNGSAQRLARPGWATSTPQTYDPAAWRFWGGDAGQTRYAPLEQINSSNVERLKIAWRWSADTSGGFSPSNFKSTPLLDDGVLYVPWLNHGMAAIDAGPGKTLWTFEPQPADIGGGASLASRSLSFWSDGRSKRLFHNTLDGRLISVDAKTGRADQKFGRQGWINLRDNLTEAREVQDVRSVSPAIVVGNVVVQVIPAAARNKAATAGEPRYEARLDQGVSVSLTARGTVAALCSLGGEGCDSEALWGMRLKIAQGVLSCVPVGFER
jgi:glucose dehydrogenase